MLGGSFWIAVLRNAMSMGLMMSFFDVGPAQVFNEKNHRMLCDFRVSYCYRLQPLVS